MLPGSHLSTDVSPLYSKHRCDVLFPLPMAQHADSFRQRGSQDSDLFRLLLSHTGMIGVYILSMPKYVHFIVNF